MFDEIEDNSSFDTIPKDRVLAALSEFLVAPSGHRPGGFCRQLLAGGHRADGHSGHDRGRSRARPEYRCDSDR